MTSIYEKKIGAGAKAIEDLLVMLGIKETGEEGEPIAVTLSRAVLLATSPPIRSQQELEDLPDESAVLTSDPYDTVMLRNRRNGFTSITSAEINADNLWRYGTHPFYVIYRPEK